MSAFNIESLLEPVSPEESCGPDLEYSPEYSEMEKAAQGTPEQQYGETIIEAVPPDWVTVRKYALELLSRTKDLRVASYLAQAVIPVDGMRAFGEVLGLLAGYISRYWKELHPRLDPDDDYDPTIRNNALGTLADVSSTLHMLRTVPLVSSRSIGRFSRRDIALARKELPAPEGTDPPGWDKIEAAFQDSPLEPLKEVAEGVQLALENLRSLEIAITDELGPGQGPNLQSLSKELDGIRKILTEQLARRGYDPSAPAAEEPAAAPQASAPAAGAPQAAAAGPARPLGEFSSREEAIKAIDLVCQWFERHEPSSPLPLLLKRAKRLSAKSFLEILRDIAPNGVGEAESLGGVALSQASHDQESSHDSEDDNY